MQCQTPILPFMKFKGGMHVRCNPSAKFWSVTLLICRTFQQCLTVHFSIAGQTKATRYGLQAPCKEQWSSQLYLRTPRPLCELLTLCVLCVALQYVARHFSTLTLCSPEHCMTCCCGIPAAVHVMQCCVKCSIHQLLLTHSLLRLLSTFAQV